MQAMHFPKILAFVEGTMEKMFINNNFHYVHLIPISNGNGWTIENMCAQIGTKYASLGISPERIVVWIDREKHGCSCERFANLIKDQLIKHGAIEESISIFIPDRKTENLILADESVIRSEFNEPDYVYSGEGKDGKHILSTLYKNSGLNYKETFHGVSLLKKIRLSRSAIKSESAKLFYDSLDLRCWWLKDT